MYKRILVPLDGSALAEQILPHVQALARCTGAEVILLRVPEYTYKRAVEFDGPFLWPPLPLQDNCETGCEEATAYLNKVKLKLPMHGVPVSTVVREGHIAQVIIEFARETGADLIAMSTHGRTGLSRAVFGSVAEEVLRLGGKPVLLIRPKL